ncbi:MAG: phosphodiesterase, MJ0936 family protein [Parcubacteria group bacterium GW2011_GWA2_47_8]|nr:MAG: phosphodiesterase, MJ0936 family protein [Parcubacteria group bacterium GW2011_GWA2_47_8]
MNIAVISDSHDAWDNIKKAVAVAQKHSCKVMLHCGDVCAPITLKYLTDQWSGELHLVFGNVDGDRWLMGERAKENPNIHIYGEALAELIFDGKRIALQHYPQLAERLAQSGQYHAVFYGHNHTAKIEEITHDEGITLLANPGPISTMIGKKASIGVYDTGNNTMSLINL